MLRRVSISSPTPTCHGEPFQICLMPSQAKKSCWCSKRKYQLAPTSCWPDCSKASSFEDREPESMAKYSPQPILRQFEVRSSGSVGRRRFLLECLGSRITVYRRWPRQYSASFTSIYWPSAIRIRFIEVFNTFLSQDKKYPLVCAMPMAVFASESLLEVLKDYGGPTTPLEQALSWSRRGAKEEEEDLSIAQLRVRRGEPKRGSPSCPRYDRAEGEGIWNPL